MPRYSSPPDRVTTLIAPWVVRLVAESKFTVESWNSSTISGDYFKIFAMSQPSGDVTALLLAWGKGDEHALERLVPLVYEELRRIARRCLRHERARHSLAATALVHEAYVRLIDTQRVKWQDRTHFLAMSARIMRQILVDHARRKRYQERGGGAAAITLVAGSARRAR